MFRIARPTATEIHRHLADRAGDAFTYPEVAATREGEAELPPSLRRKYDVDHHAAELGTGRELFLRARRALLDWRSFDVPWLELHGAASPVAAGQVVATLAHVAGLWALNPCRVVYEADAPDAGSTAFAYGTLRGHAETGEERFQVTHDPHTDRVRYEILAFSRPGHLLTRLGYAYARRVQRRFARDSLAAIARSVALPAR